MLEISNNVFNKKFGFQIFLGCTIGTLFLIFLIDKIKKSQEKEIENISSEMLDEEISTINGIEFSSNSDIKNFKVFSLK